MSEPTVPASLDPAALSPEERARAVAAVLAAGSKPPSPPGIRGHGVCRKPLRIDPNCLAESPEKSVTVSAG
jgi:hypothetical protein